MRKEGVEIRNEGDALAFRAQKSITEFKDKLPAAIVSEIQTRIDALKKALEGQDTALIKTKTADLQEHMQKIGEELAKAGSQQSQEAPKAQNNASDTIQDAEVEIVDEK